MPRRRHLQAQLARKWRTLLHAGSAHNELFIFGGAIFKMQHYEGWLVLGTVSVFEFDYFPVIVGNLTAVNNCLCRGDELRISIGININVLGESLSHHSDTGERLGWRSACSESTDGVCAAFFVAMAEETVKALNVSFIDRNKNSNKYPWENLHAAPPTLRKPLDLFLNDVSHTCR